MPAVPKPPIRTVEPSLTSPTAAAADTMSLSITVPPSLLLLGVEGGKASTLGRKFVEQRRNFPARAVFCLVGLDLLGGVRKADYIVDLPHRAPAPGGKAVAI